MEGDSSNRAIIESWKAHFNPLPPHGGRHVKSMRYVVLFTFQSTPSAWRETCIPGVIPHDLVISIHSLRMEGDSADMAVCHPSLIYFNPLPPHGGRRLESQKLQI